MNKSIKTTICHVGARDGFIPIAFPELFDRFVFFNLIDASDSPNIFSITLSDDRKPSCSYEIIKSAVWSDENTNTIYGRTCPYASGLRDFNKKYDDWFVYGNGGVDYVLGKAHLSLFREQIKTTTLDSLVKDGLINSPSILCVDAQGASYNILYGARGAVLNALDVIVVECEMIPFYEEKPSFSSINELLLESGFYLSHIIDEENRWASPVRLPLGVRGNTLMGSIDAVFVRDPSFITSSDILRKIRYLFSLSLAGHLDIGLWPILKDDTSISSLIGLPCQGPLESYARELVEAYQVSPKVYPNQYGVTPDLKPDIDSAICTYRNIAKVVSKFGFTNLLDPIARQIELLSYEL